MIGEEVETTVFTPRISNAIGQGSLRIRMTAVLLEAIKELKQEVDELRHIYIKDMNRKNK